MTGKTLIRPKDYNIIRPWAPNLLGYGFLRKIYTGDNFPIVAYVNTKIREIGLVRNYEAVVVTIMHWGVSLFTEPNEIKHWKYRRVNKKINKETIRYVADSLFLKELNKYQPQYETDNYKVLLCEIS